MTDTDKGDVTGLYRALEPLSLSRRDQFLVPTNCYPHLNHVRALPIAHLEAWQLATVGPILWRAAAAGPELILVVAESLNQAKFANLVRPRLSVAYPFAAATLDEAALAKAEGDSVVMWDRPEEPLPAGVIALPIFDSKRNFIPEVQKRIEALLIFAAARERTTNLTRYLMEQDLLQTWSGHLTIGGIGRPLLGGSRVSDNWLERLDQSKIPREDLPALFELVEAHLISLRRPDLKIGGGEAEA